MNHDELQAAIEADERQDALETLRYMGIREYAKAMGIVPQKVYYYIRNRKVHPIFCPMCGRKVIAIEEADSIFNPKEDLDRPL